jgi:hypothetical protein
LYELKYLSLSVASSIHSIKAFRLSSIFLAVLTAFNTDVKEFKSIELLILSASASKSEGD